MAPGGDSVNHTKLEQLMFLRARREDMRRQLASLERRFSATERAIAVFQSARNGLPDPTPEIDALELEHRARYAPAASGMRQSIAAVSNQITHLLADMLRTGNSPDDAFALENSDAEKKLLETDWWGRQGKPTLDAMYGD